MNYITLINNFWEKYKTSPVSSGAVALFFAILNQANQRRWQFPIHLTNTFLQAEIHISKNIFFKGREELRENGYIIFHAVNNLVGSAYYLCISDKKGSIKSGNDFENEFGNEDTDLKTNLKTDSQTNLKTDLKTENELSSYNNKTIKENINKDFKQKRFYNKNNDKEIYDSGRYDYERIARVARQRIRERLAEE